MLIEESSAIESFAQAFVGRAQLAANKPVAPVLKTANEPVAAQHTASRPERASRPFQDWWEDSDFAWPGGLVSFPPPMGAWATHDGRHDLAADRADQARRPDRFDRGYHDPRDGSCTDCPSDGNGHDSAATVTAGETFPGELVRPEPGVDVFRAALGIAPLIVAEPVEPA